MLQARSLQHKGAWHGSSNTSNCYGPRASGRFPCFFIIAYERDLRGSSPIHSQQFKRTQDPSTAIAALCISPTSRFRRVQRHDSAGSCRVSRSRASCPGRKATSNSSSGRLSPSPRACPDPQARRRRRRGQSGVSQKQGNQKSHPRRWRTARISAAL